MSYRNNQKTTPKRVKISISLVILGLSLVVTSCFWPTTFPGVHGPRYDWKTGDLVATALPDEPGDPGASGVHGDLGNEPVTGGEVGQDTGSTAGSGDLKPVGFVNYGEFNATVRAWTYVPLGSTEAQPPSAASTTSTANSGSGTWPNTSRYISVPMGTYSWCIDWEEGDLDDDGQMDYFH